MTRGKITLIGNTFKGGGVRVRGDMDIEGHSNTFTNVATPFDVGPNVDVRLRDTNITADPKNGRRGRNQIVSTGWTRPKGPALPVYCPNCHCIFPSQNYVFGGRFFESWGNVEDCVACDSTGAKLSEGLFNVSRELVEILVAPDITYVMIQALAGVTADFSRGQLSKSSALGKLSAISPKFAALFSRAIPIGGGALAILTALLACWALMLQHEERDLSKRQLELSEREAALGAVRDATKDWQVEQALEALWQISESVEKIVEQNEAEAGAAPPNKESNPKTPGNSNSSKESQE